MRENVVATILFADLMDSTEMAKNLTLHEYDDMLVNFQSTLFEVVSDHLKQYGYAGNGVDAEWSVVGDELRVFLYSEETRYDVRNALLIATKVKLAWLTSDFNQRILREGRLVSRVGAGINCGDVIKGVREWRMRMGQEHSNVEGYAINLTKRIESASREGVAYQIMVGDSLHRVSKENKHLNVRFGKPRNLGFKGLGQKIPVYEVISFVNFEILPFMPESLQKGLLDKLEYAVTRPMPEPWIFITLMRHYISLISSGKNGRLEAKAVKLAEQALEAVDYKAPIHNMLAWLYGYGKTIHNPEMAFFHLDQSLGIDPTNRAALLHRARILDKMGQIDLARHAYGEVLVHDHEHPEARKKVAEYFTR
jgi:class 3 adenylate cyclase